MKKNNILSRPKTTIDISLFSLAYNKQLSKSQKLIFDKWINEDSSHRLYFEKATRFYKEGTVFNNEIVDIESDWKKIENKLHANKSSKKEEITIYDNNGKIAKNLKINLNFQIPS